MTNNNRSRIALNTLARTIHSKTTIHKDLDLPTEAAEELSLCAICKYIQTHGWREDKEDVLCLEYDGEDVWTYCTPTKGMKVWRVVLTTKEAAKVEFADWMIPELQS
jgi:hypothetical protein